MKSLIIYYSKHNNNTEKIARTMAEELDAELLKVEDCTGINLLNYDIIGFGSGIYMSNFHKSIIELIDNIKGLENKKVFIFSTSGSSIKKGNEFEEKIKQSLIKRKTQFLGSFNCRGFSNYFILKLFGGMNKGKLYQVDLNNAKDFIKKIKI